MKLGQKYVLWRSEYKRDAYIDQFEHQHAGYLVLEQIVVTVSEICNTVKDMWTGLNNCTGWKAVSESGEVFTCNWEVYPSDSMTPTYYWDVREDARGLWQPEDACQAWDMYPHVDANGQKIMPIGTIICDKHHIASIDEPCWRCAFEKEKEKSNQS